MSHTPPFIYVPNLRPSFARCPVPRSVAFFHPGLPDALDDWPRFVPDSYPLDALAARAVLNELLQIGAQMDAELRSGARAGALEAPELAALQLFPEGADIDREIQQAFAGMENAGREFWRNPPAGTADADKPEDGALLRARLAAQKSLLLGWDLEERLEEIYRLQEEVAESGKSLSRLLGDGQSQEQMLDALLTAFAHHGSRGNRGSRGGPGGSGGEGGEDGLPRPDWRLMLGAMAPFLPEGARLFTCNTEMGVDLRERGLLEPVSMGSEDVALDDLPAPLFAAHAPLWHILGRAKIPEDKPWLLVPVHLFVHLPEHAV